MIKVLLVDDHDLVRTGIRSLLNEANGVEVIEEADNGEDAIKKARVAKPDVILMDVTMPGIGGLEATRKITHTFPDIKVIALTVHGAEPFPSRLLQAGAAGYITKGSAPEEMVEAIKTVFAGKRFITADIAQQLAIKNISDAEESPFDSLSEREMQVMLMIVKGEKVQEISEKLHLSPKTVNSYRYRLFEKLNVSSDVELTHLAFRHGIVATEEV